jgi:HSP20 family protein
MERFSIIGSDWMKEWQHPPLKPPVESFIEGDRYTVRIDLPGVDPNAIEITARGTSLTIKGRREKRGSGDAQYYQREPHFGAFERSLRLPEDVRAETLQAKYHHGILELTTRIDNESPPRKIKLRVSSTSTPRLLPWRGPT